MQQSSGRPSIIARLFTRSVTLCLTEALPSLLPASVSMSALPPADSSSSDAPLPYRLVPIVWSTLGSLREGVDYNTNNHAQDRAGRPVDSAAYASIFAHTKYLDSLYMYPTGEREAHRIIQLSQREAKALCKVAEVATVTGVVRPSQWEDLEGLEQRLKAELEKLNASVIVSSPTSADSTSSSSSSASTPRWFLRLDSCSPKDSSVGLGVRSARDIITALATSRRCHHAMQRDLDQQSAAGGAEEPSISLILKPWRSEVCTKTELRAFVHGRRLTAVSQYRLINDCPWSSLQPAQWEAILREMQLMVKKLRVDSCVLDVHVTLPVSSEPKGADGDLPPNAFAASNSSLRVEFLETNCWGREGPAGSALFEWTKDAAVLYGDDPQAPVEIRFIQ